MALYLLCDAGPLNFIPVHFILNKTVSLVDKLDAVNGNVILVLDSILT